MTFPLEFAVLDYIPTCHDQGYYNTCVAESFALIKEMMEYKEKFSEKTFSLNYIFGNRDLAWCETSSWYCTNKNVSGMYITPAYYALENYGICEYSLAPSRYDYPTAQTQFDYRHGFENVRNDALYHRIYDRKSVTYSSDPVYITTEIDDLKEYLMSYGAVSFTVDNMKAIDYLWDYRYQGKYIITPNEYDYSGGREGSHMMVIVGWKQYQGEGYWIARNSWGSSFGKNGFFLIPYYYPYFGEVDIPIDVMRDSFAFKTSIAKGTEFGMLADEWNSMTYKLKCLVYTLWDKEPSSVYSQITHIKNRIYNSVMSNNTYNFLAQFGDSAVTDQVYNEYKHLKASDFNLFKNDLDTTLNAVGLGVTGISDKTTGKAIYASEINTLKDKLNELVGYTQQHY